MKLNYCSYLIKSTIFFSFMQLSMSVSAQTITGTVRSKEQKIPLEGVAVFLYQSSNGTVTNNDGFFHLVLDKKLKSNDSLVFQHLGYERQTISVSDFLDTSSDVELSESVEKLSEVILNSELKRNNKLRPIPLPEMQKPLSAFDIILDTDKHLLYVIGGNESYAEQNMKRLLR